jgi:hypothetical protein
MGMKNVVLVYYAGWFGKPYFSSGIPVNIIEPDATGLQFEHFGCFSRGELGSYVAY